MGVYFAETAFTRTQGPGIKRNPQGSTDLFVARV
jgi:hypothetical protein